MNDPIRRAPSPSLAPPGASGATGATDSSLRHSSFIRSRSAAMQPGADLFLEKWALDHFAVSVKLHDAERGRTSDGEHAAVLEDLAIVQGVLLELYDFSSLDDRVRARMEATTTLQNGVAALYAWLDGVLDQVSWRHVAPNRPGFVDVGDEAFAAILRTLEGLHPDLEALVRAEPTGGDDEDVARKLSLCFRQIGAAVVRVSGRGVSSILPPRP
jgi:hypothetical protein